MFHILIHVKRLRRMALFEVFAYCFYIIGNKRTFVASPAETP